MARVIARLPATVHQKDQRCSHRPTRRDGSGTEVHDGLFLSQSRPSDLFILLRLPCNRDRASITYVPLSSTTYDGLGSKWRSCRGRGFPLAFSTVVVLRGLYMPFGMGCPS